MLRGSLVSYLNLLYYCLSFVKMTFSRKGHHAKGSKEFQSRGALSDFHVTSSKLENKKLYTVQNQAMA